MIKILSNLWRRRQTPPEERAAAASQHPEIRVHAMRKRDWDRLAKVLEPEGEEASIEELREYRGHLKRQVHTIDKQIDELTLQKIREAGLGA